MCCDAGASSDYGAHVFRSTASTLLNEKGVLILAMGGAHSNSMYVAAADRVGVERDQPFLGCSLIVSHTGFPLAGPASKTEEEIIYAELNLSDARRKRVLNNFNQPLRDRRIDLYDEMLGASIKRGWY
jgi:predicted amidohydrolase